jgi:hypothetical protein
MAPILWILTKKNLFFRRTTTWGVACDMLDEATECYGITLNIKHTRAHQGLACVHYLKNRKHAVFDEIFLDNG